MLFPTKNAINHKKIVLITFCQQTNNLNVFCNICVGTHFPLVGKTYIPMSVLVHFINLQPFHPQPLGFEANWAPDVSPGNLGPWKILCGKLGPWKIGPRQIGPQNFFWRLIGPGKYTLVNMLQLNLYIVIGYILPTIGGYMSIGG